MATRLRQDLEQVRTQNRADAREHRRGLARQSLGERRTMEMVP